MAVVAIISASVLQSALLLQGPFRTQWKMALSHVTTAFDHPPKTARILGRNVLECNMYQATFAFHFRSTPINSICFTSTEELTQNFAQHSQDNEPYLIIVPDLSAATNLTAGIQEKKIGHRTTRYPTDLHIFVLGDGEN